METFDRYATFKGNGKVGIVPYVKITEKKTDKYIRFDKKTMRLDIISHKYYGSPDYAWLIMQSNPEYGSIENFIDDGVVLRIPYPLDETLNRYLNDLIKHKELNGNE